MGKPYAKELDWFPESYRVGIEQGKRLTPAAFGPLLENPLVAIGSGGSLTAAHLAVLLHIERTGELARAMTPLEVISARLNANKCSFLFLTAGGSNPDILGSYRHVIRREPAALLAICARQSSKLARIASRLSDAGVIDFDLPSGKDGFLATNSLLATGAALVMGYDSKKGASDPLPCELDDLLGWAGGFDAGLARLRTECSAIWPRPTTVLLHGYWGQPAAIDFESKFTESSMGHLQIADYRHFAHGRHNWIGQRPSECAIISLEAPPDRGVADETLSLIPKSVPRVRIQLSAGGPRGALEAITYSLCMAQLAGEARSIDPGRPQVRNFGRTLYHLNVYRDGRSPTSQPALEKSAIERKAGVSIEELAQLGTSDAWLRAYNGFIERLRSESLAGVVLDFDGTLIGCADRDAPVSVELSEQLSRLIELGLTIGVATGRGDSAHATLRSSLPRRLAKSVVIGFHNGAVISRLSDRAPADAIDDPSPELGDLFRRLQADELIRGSTRMQLGNSQITVHPLPGISRDYVWDALRVVTGDVTRKGMNIWRSSHSIDITSPGVSKRLVVEHLRGMSPLLAVGGILCIGDMGKWPGNDYDLLREPLSLSVDEVSPDPNTCWRVSPEGVRGIEATIWYLKRIEKEEGKIVFNRP